MPKDKKKAAAPAAKAEPVKAEPADAEDEEAEEEVQKGSKRDGTDVSRVTDYVETKELDSAKAADAVAMLTKTTEVDRAAELARERELAAVQIDKADVDLIATEMELDREVAERRLREHKGDAIATLNTLVAA